MGVRAARCSACGGDAFYRQTHSKRLFCRGCFADYVETKVRRTISRYGMLKPVDRVAVAVSGGKDSLCLSAILARIEEGFAQSEVVAITIDEGIGRYREEAIRIASSFCMGMGMEHVVYSFEDLFGLGLDEIAARRAGASPCSYCGVLRRKALNVAAREIGADKLATAHNLDDVVQTFLMNVLHGNVDRIPLVAPVTAASHPRFVTRVKPFYELLEREVSLYAYLRSVPLQSSVCPYATASLRSDVRMLLNRLEALHPGTKWALFHSFRKIQRSLPSPGVRLGDCRVCGEPTAREICKACLLLRDLS